MAQIKAIVKYGPWSLQSAELHFQI